MAALPADLAALSDLATPWCIRVVATLRIADRIAAGISDVDDLAAAAGCDADSLHRVLAHLVGKGVFEQPAPRWYGLNEAARELLEPGNQLYFDLDSLGGRFAHAWGTMLAAVRSGACAYRDHFGMTFWEDLDAHPEVGASFDALMGSAGHGTPDPDILLDGDWVSVRTVVDVGGGTGAMLAEILRAHADLRGTLVDLPKTVARSAPVFAAAGVSDRVTAVAQSFFELLPAGADLYLLTKVLNDWQDREAAAILRRCAEAMSATGRLVVIGGVSGGRVAGEPATPRLTEEAILVRGLGGKERTLDIFRQLARDAGLDVSAAAHQPSGRFVVECRVTGRL